METKEMKIDFDELSKSMQQLIREKAIKAKSCIVYKEDNDLIEESPLTGEKKILKTYPEVIKV